MIIICHRVNALHKLIKTNEEYGIEVDLRSLGNRIIIHHDPFSKGIFFNDWIKKFKHKYLILNVKEEGLEMKILNILKKNKKKNFFFLDQSFPFLIKLSKKLKKKSAVRVSEFESFKTILSVKNKVNWVWVDFFSKYPLSSSEFKKLKNLKLKLCYVSPELQGYSKNITEKFIKYIKKKKLIPDAVCTKYPMIWKKLNV